jgi:hypothetical protein
MHWKNTTQLCGRVMVVIVQTSVSYSEPCMNRERTPREEILLDVGFEANNADHASADPGGEWCARTSAHSATLEPFPADQIGGRLHRILLRDGHGNPPCSKITEKVRSDEHTETFYSKITCALTRARYWGRAINLDGKGLIAVSCSDGARYVRGSLTKHH